MTRALVIGAGGLGGPAALGLLSLPCLRAVTLLDDDVVDETNLSRQMFYGDADVGRPKVEVLADALAARRPGLSLEPRVERFVEANADGMVDAHDIVLDGSDRFETRFLANDACVRAGKVLVHGAALGWRGQVMLIAPGRTPCLRCVFEGPPPEAPSCGDAGVAAPLVGLVGCWMAEAARACIEGIPGRWVGNLRTFDGLHDLDRWASVGRDPTCSACSALG